MLVEYIALAAAFVLAGCGDDDNADGRVAIEFFQNKSEAKGTFDRLIAKFNEQQTDIRVTQVNPPEAETILKTRVDREVALPTETAQE